MAMKQKRGEENTNGENWRLVFDSDLAVSHDLHARDTVGCCKLAEVVE